MNPGAIATRNDGSFAAPMDALEGIYVITTANTIESICADPAIYFQKLWLYPLKAVDTTSGQVTVNGSNVTLGKSGNAGTQNITSLVGVSTLVTATLANHGYKAGMSVTITGATETGYNGTFRIKNVTRDTFDYVRATAVTDGKQTGSITVRRTRYLPDTLAPTDTLGMVYQVPDGMKMRLSDIIIYGAQGDGVFYSFV